LTVEAIFGPPGCGKTHTLIDLVKQALERGVAPDRIAYVSFTKKAVNEAVKRAGEAFGLTQKDLPYFRTLHSLCFRSLGLNKSDVMDAEDWANLGRELRLNFKEGRNVNLDDGQLLPSEGSDDGYLRIIDRAALRQVSLEREFNDAQDYALSYPALLRVSATLESYKKARNRFHFTDMLQYFIKSNMPPRLELLIVDEAQDLVPLQWSVVKVLASNSQNVYYAGDDDQAIHEWAGVDVKHFLNCSNDKRILTQSYRLPIKVHTLAENLVRRISVRQKKVWAPTSREGSVRFHMDRFSVPLNQGSWTAMARTNYQVAELAKAFRDDGVYFQRGDYRSIPLDVAFSIESLTNLYKGMPISKDTAKRLYKKLPKSGNRTALREGALSSLDTADPEGLYDFNLLTLDYGLRVPKDKDPLQVLNINSEDEVYIRSVIRRGENIIEPPKIKLSTVHAMKGGEDDNIMLMLDSTKNCVTNPDQDTEHRVFYVGITRAKHNLHIVESNRKYRYEI
jgi:DNA helicase II / ATP-dependent DNA helicase PcrA